MSRAGIVFLPHTGPPNAFLNNDSLWIMIIHNLFLATLLYSSNLEPLSIKVINNHGSRNLQQTFGSNRTLSSPL